MSKPEASGGVSLTPSRVAPIPGPLSAGWKAFRANARLCLGALLTWILAWVVLEVLVFLTHDWGVVPNVLLHLAYLFLASALELGFLTMALRISEGERPSYSDLYARLDGGAGFLVAKVVYLVTVVVGLALLIVPGVLLGVRYSMFALHMAAGETEVRRAFAASARTVEGRGGRVLGFLIRVALLNVAAVCLLGLGLIISLPTSALAAAIFYRRLNEASNS